MAASGMATSAASVSASAAPAPAPAAPVSSSASSDARVVHQQQQLWASLKLDPLLISHATGLHRVLHDVTQLRDKFQKFASYTLRMANMGADLATQLHGMYKPGTAPAGMRQMAEAHTIMAAVGLDCFSHQFKNELLNRFKDWLEDAEAVLSQLGLVQKARHELDGLQESIERLFSKRAEAPLWDMHAEANLQKKLELSKEKLAVACMLYDGQRRGVEKSMQYLLSSRQQLFHQVAACFTRYEQRFFRECAVNTAALVATFPSQTLTPCELEHTDDVFGAANAAHPSACELMLTLPYFQWTDPSRPSDVEGPNVRAIRRAMDKAARRSPSATIDGSIAAPVHSKTNWETTAAAGEWDEKAAAAHQLTQSKPNEPLDDAATMKLVQQTSMQLSRQMEAACDAGALPATASAATPLPAEAKQAEEPSAPVAVSASSCTLTDGPTSLRSTTTLSSSVVQTGEDHSPESDSILASTHSAASTTPLTDEKEQADIFVSPIPLEECASAPPIVHIQPPASASASTAAADSSSSSPIPLAPSAVLVACASESAMLREMSKQAAAAATLSLPAKLLSHPRPSTRLQAVLWAPVPLHCVKGSIWSTILVDHLKFDEDTDEMREEFSLNTTSAPMLERAFRTDTPHAFTTPHSPHASHAPPQRPVARAQLNPDSQPSADAPGTSGVGRLSKNRFADMKTIDGDLYSPLSAAASSTSSPTCFPARPYPGISSKSWYLAYLTLTRVLYPLTPAQAVEAIYRLDDSVLTPPRVNALMRIMPTEQQRATILAAARPLPLTSLEQLFTFLSLHTTPSLSLRLSALHFQNEFGPLCQQLESTLDAIEKCVVEVKRNQSLRVLLAVLLNLGNFSNSSHFVPPSYGFHIDFLERLAHIRTTNAGATSTMLEYLVEHLSTHHPQLSFSAFSPSSFPHLAKAMRINEWLLAMELSYLEEQYRAVRSMNEEDDFEKQSRSVQAQPPAAAADALALPFPVAALPPRASRFLSYMQARTTVLRHRYMNAKSSIQDLCRYLCVAPCEVVDPSADATAALHCAADGLGFAHLPPLGEVATNANTQPPTHTRLDWQGALRMLHRFAQDFSQAYSDFAVLPRADKAPNHR